MLFNLGVIYNLRERSIKRTKSQPASQTFAFSLEIMMRGILRQADFVQEHISDKRAHGFLIIKFFSF